MTTELPDSNYTLEVIGFNIESCLAAQEAGAGRIELCGSPGEGGSTPSFGLIHAARKHLRIPVYVMIRPRGGDFLYSDAEFETMIQEIEVCKQAGIDGIVTGLLDSSGNIDIGRCRRLINRAFPLGATFHRAFDWVSNPLQALEDVIGLGFERILTSGLQPKAIDALPLLRKLVIQADERISIMPGSGVRPDNIQKIAEETGARELHSSASLQVKSGMAYYNTSMQEEVKYAGVDQQAVREMAGILSDMSREP